MQISQRVTLITIHICALYMHKHLFRVVTTVARNEEKYDGLALAHSQRTSSLNIADIAHIIYDERP